MCKFTVVFNKFIKRKIRLHPGIAIMVLTFSVVLLGLLALVRPLQRNNFYVLHAALIIPTAYYIETHYFKVTPFAPKTFLLFLVFQLISINLVTFFAYYIDKRAAKRGQWRVPEANLHTLEFLGGWTGALLAQKIFRHKTKKKSYQTTFMLVVALELALIYFVIKFIAG